MLAKSRKTRGFTLVELLVVIGIIALLISILLPSLQKAKRAAATVQCSSNMRQVAAAMLMYVNANKGTLPPSAFPSLSTPPTPPAQPTGPYPYGFWWANELVRQKYISAPNVYPTADSSGNTNRKVFGAANAFRCPEGTSEADMNGGQGLYPTDALNNGYAGAPSLSNDALGSKEGFFIATWYQLTSRVANSQVAGMSYPDGTNPSPFCWFNSTTQVTDPTNNNTYLLQPRFTRKLSMIRRASEVVMIVEAADPNWYDDSAPATEPHGPDGKQHCKRMGARHGKKTADGYNAYTNFAFFDGHVALYPTIDYQDPIGGQGLYSQIHKQGTIFILNQQR